MDIDGALHWRSHRVFTETLPWNKLALVLRVNPVKNIYDDRVTVVVEQSVVVEQDGVTVDVEQSVVVQSVVVEQDGVTVVVEQSVLVEQGVVFV